MKARFLAFVRIGSTPLSNPHSANTAIMDTSLPSLSLILLSVWQVALADFSQLGRSGVGVNFQLKQRNLGLLSYLTDSVSDPDPY